MIKAIIYDLGDIFFEAHYWREWMWETLSRIGKYDKSFVDFYELYEKYLLPVYQGKKAYWEGYDDFLGEFDIVNKDEFTKLSKMQKLFYENNRVLYDGVKETLEQLHSKGTKNIIITDNENGAVWVRDNILKKFGVNEFIDFVVTSKEAGATKPNPKIFELAINYFSLNINDVIFVAHDEDEIDGAVKFGIQVIEYNNYLKLKTNTKIRINEFSEILFYL